MLEYQIACCQADAFRNEMGLCGFKLATRTITNEHETIIACNVSCNQICNLRICNSLNDIAELAATSWQVWDADD